MSKNIYDLFNERKNGIDCLVEGYDFSYDNLDAYEDLLEAANDLHAITLESTNEMIEFQAACYLEDLVLESMMYENFDEEQLQNVMEAAKDGKKEGFVQKVKNLWQRIKEWFVRTIKSVANFFKSGETLVAKYRRDIPKAMAQSKAKVKMRGLQNMKSAIDQVEAMDKRLQVVGRSKEQILGLVGLNDANGARKKVEKLFYATDEAKEYEIAKLPDDIVTDYAGNSKITIDGLKKSQKEIDGKFKEMLADLQKGDDKNKAENVANFQFGIGVANSLLSAEIACVNNIGKACTAVIRKALSGKYDPSKEKDTTAPDSKDVQANNKDIEKAKKKGMKVNHDGMGRYALPESFEIIDEEDYVSEGYEDNNDDFEW